MESLASILREAASPNNYVERVDPHMGLTKDERIALMAERWENGKDIWDGHTLSHYERHGVSDECDD